MLHFFRSKAWALFPLIGGLLLLGLSTKDYETLSFLGIDMAIPFWGMLFFGMFAAFFTVVYAINKV